jgi:hypothetical protein
MTANERKATRALSPVQLRAIALRVQGLDITEIAGEVGRDRTTVSRWFTADPLVIKELDRRVEDQYETELQQQANLRTKAMGVVEAALDGGDVRAALTILRLSPRQKDHGPAEKGISSPSTNPFGAARGPIGQDDVDALLRELEVMSPWQVHVQRVDALLRSPDPAADVKGILDRLLFLDDVAGTVVQALEEANGEGLTGYSSVTGQQQEVFLGDARRAIDEAWAIVGGTDDDDDDDEPKWPGEDSADRAIRLIGEALLALLASLEGAPKALTRDAGASGARLAARLTAAHGTARLVIDSDERPTVRSLAHAVALLTDGFRDLVGALSEAATIAVDLAWAEASDGYEGGADA